MVPITNRIPPLPTNIVFTCVPEMTHNTAHTVLWLYRLHTTKIKEKRKVPCNRTYPCVLQCLSSNGHSCLINLNCKNKEQHKKKTYLALLNVVWGVILLLDSANGIYVSTNLRMSYSLIVKATFTRNGSVLCKISPTRHSRDSNPTPVLRNHIRNNIFGPLFFSSILRVIFL